MNIPLNGRVAIIDDKEDEALPLIKLLAKNRIPYVFYKGTDPEFLPEENDKAQNDIRLLFLDLNLLGGGSPSDKDIQEALYAVLNKVISKNNFPYLIILWSRQEKKYTAVVEELFNDRLADRKPIDIVSFVKSDVFPTSGEVGDIDLLKEINNRLIKESGYRYLLNWENQVHKSADVTLQSVFSSYHSFTNWTDNANYIFNKLSYSYLGGHFKPSTIGEKIRGGYQAFNSVFLDSLETLSANVVIDNPHELKYEIDNVNVDTKYSINKKLLLTEDNLVFNYPGSIIYDTDPAQKGFYNDLVSKCISHQYIKHKVSVGNSELSPEDMILQSRTIHKEIMDSIRKDYFKIHCFVTPLCDFIQKNNNKFDRIVSGLVIAEDQKMFVDDKHESLFVSPSFELDGKPYFLVIDFRCFHTSAITASAYQKATFRIRQQLLAEIQSKLARHINRQGILFID